MKITAKSQIETRLPEQMPYRITNDHCYSVRPNIAKPNVSGSLFLSSISFCKLPYWLINFKTGFDDNNKKPNKIPFEKT